MAQNTIDQLRQRMQEVERQCEEIKQQREEEERRYEEIKQQREEEQRWEEEDRRYEEAKRQLRNTTLPEFLNACHEKLFRGLRVQKDKDPSTKGNPANTDHKICPKWIKEWTGFPQEQVKVWDDIIDSGPWKRGQRQDDVLRTGPRLFGEYTLETRVASVIKVLYANPRLQRIFHLHGDVTFENHANSLTDESSIVEDLSSLSLTLNEPRRSMRLAAKSSRVEHPAPLSERSQATQPKSTRPRADQLCVYNKGPERKDPAFIIEYKVPHKVSLAHIKAGLQDMDVDEVVHVQDKESPEDICRRVIAAVITQTYSYMINAGLEFGYACTGEAFVFLRVSHDDPSTVYYYLSVPEEDVGPSTGWNDNLFDDNRLHLTAVGQVLAFTLRALRAPIRNIAWINRARDSLKTWSMIYDDLLDKIAETDIPSSAFRSLRSRNRYLHMSPVKIRQKSAIHSSLFSSSPPANASRGSRSRGKSRQHCTQQCLRGLIMGGKLDIKCPNAVDHGVDQHRLNPKTLMHRLDKQLSSENPNCESLHIHGTRGALFKVTVRPHGYTFVGKGVPVEFIKGSKHEEFVYSHLTSIQGVYVSVVLGSLDLRRPFSYDGIAEMVHMMFMSYTAQTLVKQKMDPSQLIQQAQKSLQAIHQLGVLHSDPIAGNMTWNEEWGQVMFIDFERAVVQNRRIPLGSVSANKERKRGTSKCSDTGSDCFERETRRMIRELE